jgi:hypothetical protein
MELSGAAGDGRLEEDRPSGKLVSTVLTLVWAIAGICGTRRFSGARGVEGMESLTGSHMSGDMLRTSEGGLAYRTLVIPGHRGSQLQLFSQIPSNSTRLSPWE